MGIKPDYWITRLKSGELGNITNRIIKQLFYTPIKKNFPCVIFIQGKSGHGKSWTALKLQEILLSFDGLDLKDFVEDINISIPLEYPEKLNKILHDKELKKVRIICVHEARLVVNAKQWQDFVTQSIAHVNALSRAVKPLIFMVVSQNIRDVTTDIRYTIDYIVENYRPVHGDAQFKLFKMFTDNRDLEHPILRKRPVMGLVKKNRRWRLHKPQKFIVKKPDKETRERFEKADREAKIKIIKNMMDKLMLDLTKNLDTENKKVGVMVEWYTKHPEQIPLIGKRSKRGFRLHGNVSEMHELTSEEKKLFEKTLNEKIEQGFI